MGAFGFLLFVLLTVPGFADQSIESKKDEEEKLARLTVPLLAERSTAPSESKELQQAIEDFSRRSQGDDFSTLETYLAKNPGSPWKLTIMRSLAEQYYASGRFGKALEMLEQAWDVGRKISDPKLLPVAHDVFGELLKLHCKLGGVSRLEELQAEADGILLRGAGQAKALEAWEVLRIMQDQPEISFRCGPIAFSEALKAYDEGRSEEIEDCLGNLASTPQGLSLAHLDQKNEELGGPFQMAYRERGAEVIFPAVVHWKVGHFAALISRHGRDILCTDRTFLARLSLSNEALDDEASGYFLVPKGPLPSGWRRVSREEGATVWGRGYPGTIDNTDVNCTIGGNKGCSSRKMPRYSMTTMTANLQIQDTPIWYDSAFGAPLEFTIQYNQRDVHQPAGDLYSNLGPFWTHHQVAFVTYNPGALPWPVSATIYERGGGLKTFNFPAFSSGGGNGTEILDPLPCTSISNAKDGSRLEYLPKVGEGATFTRVFKDGSREVYDFSDMSSGTVARSYLTRVSTRRNISINYQWQLVGSTIRLASITNEAGNTHALHYELSQWPSRITKVSDEFGREAFFDYDAQGRLKQVTDMGGISSEFEYSGDEVVGLVTPYGRTQFVFQTDGLQRSLEVIDPSGGKERMEFRPGSSVTFNDPGGAVRPEVPSWDFADSYFQYRNSFYWNQKAMKQSPLDYNTAEIFHWVHGKGYMPGAVQVLEHYKKPLENRVFFRYAGQGPTGDHTGSRFEGDNPWPLVKARRVKDSQGAWATQVEFYEYDEFGNITKFTDPVGRTTRIAYNGPENSPSQIRVDSGSGTEIVWQASYTGLGAGSGRPGAITDAAGQTTLIEWHPTFKQPTKITNPKGEIVEIAYYTNAALPSYGRVQTISGALPNTPIDYTYDAFGRVQSVTDETGYTLAYEYDLLDRVTKITYPDNTTEEIVYRRLDPEWIKDRAGRWTGYFHDYAQRVAAVLDPLNRWTLYDWCSCGALHSMTDAVGNKTKFKHDVQLRTIEKEYADGEKVLFGYEIGSSRLASITDAKGQRQNFRYYLDDNLADITHTDTSGQPLVPPTPGVALAYDPYYDRLATMTDGMGTTEFAYHPVSTGGQLGAGQLASVDGPLANDTITYSYDELGRQLSRAIDSSSETVSYDALGRIAGILNALGSFTPSYNGWTRELEELLYPNGMKMLLDYYGNTGDRRVEELEYRGSGGATRARFGYEYDATGAITGWEQMVGEGEGVRRYSLTYDRTNQLLGGILREVSTGAVVGAEGFSYDKAGNRLTRQNGAEVVTGSYNNLNQLTELSGGGKAILTGKLDEPGTVSVGGQPVEVDGEHGFRAEVDATVGANSVPIVATDTSNNATSRNAVFSLAETGERSFAYDANGNLMSDGQRNYEWDAENRLIAITYEGNTNRSEFSYDGFGRRVRVVEKTGGVVRSEKHYVWDGLEIAQQRDGSNTVEKEYFGQGFIEGGEKYFYVRDHLGSVRELTDENGVTVSAYDYDPYGKEKSGLPGGMKLWLKADTGVTKDGSNKVSAWADQSGNGSDAVQTGAAAQPTWVENGINGRAVLRFDGTDDVLIGSNNGYNPSGGDFTMIVVHQRSTSATWTAPFTFSQPGGAHGAPLMTWRNNTEQFGINNVGRADAGVFVNLAASARETHVSTIQRRGGTSGNGGALTVRSMGNATLSEARGTQGWSSNASAGYAVGRHWSEGTGHYLAGDVAEVIVYDRVLTPAERTRVEAYLAKKYARNLVQSDFRFTGHYYHEESGLVLAPYRAYDPETARWLSRDPFGSVTSQMNAGMFGTASLDYYLMGISQPEMLPFGPNLYGYVGGNPVNYIDPEGEVAPWIVGAGVGAGISFGTQFWNNGGFSDLWSGRFGDAWNKAAKCTDWVDVGLSAASGALFGGAITNAGKAAQGLRTVSEMRKVTPVYTSPYLKRHIINDVLKDTAKAAGKGVGAAAVGLGKSEAGFPRNMCD